MNMDEEVAFSYLKENYGKVEFEPDGNIPPDFSIDGCKIGIEVRRLNQQFQSEGKSKGLEERTIPLNKLLNNEMKKYPEVINTECYWFSIYYEKDIGNVNEIKKTLHQFFKKFEDDGEKYPASSKLSDNVEIEIRAKGASNTSHIKKYNLATIIDKDSGGYLTQIYADSINYCLSEKAGKIKPYKVGHDEWWLLLIDRIGCFKYDDFATLHTFIKIPSEVKKVLIVDPVDMKLIKEI